jgi:hypothetical protein
MVTASSLFGFFAGWVVSTIVIYVVTKVFHEKEGLGRAALTAFIGAVIYSVAYFLLGNGLLAALIGGIVWLAALGALYKMGWLKALIVAAVIWIATGLIGLVLPTAPGPL